MGGKRYAVGGTVAAPQVARIRPVSACGAQDFRRFLIEPRAVGTCADLFGLWIEELERNDSKSVMDARSTVNCHLLPALGPESPASVTPQWVDAIARALAASGQSHWSVRRIVSRLSSAFNYGIEIGAISANPCRGVRLPRRMRRSLRGEAERLSLSQLGHLLRANRVPWDRRLLWATLALTGVRINEAAALQWGHIERAEPLKKLWVKVAVHQKTGRVRETKTNDVKPVPIPADLCRLIDQSRFEWLRTFGRDPRPDDMLIPFVSEVGIQRPTRWNSRTALKKWHEDLDSVLGAAETPFGMRRVHALRHTFVSLVASTAGATPAAQALTHEVDGSAYWRYCHLDWSALCAAVSGLVLP